MTSISMDIRLEADADTVWAAVRDVGNAQRIFAPVITDCRMDDDSTRVVTFANGMVAHERIVDIDDAARRLAYTVVGRPFTHHHATFVVNGTDHGACVLSWVSDVLPDDAAPMVEDLMREGALAAQHALARRVMLQS